MTYVEIRQISDYSLLAALNEEVQALHHALYPDLFKPYDKTAVAAFFKEMLKDENTIAFVAYQNSIPIAYTVIILRATEENAFQHARRFVLLDQLLVKEPYRQNGIGKLLLEKVYDVARENDIKKIQLNTGT